MDYKYHFKIILVGNAGVGKTAMVRRFTRGFFPFQEAPTIGVDMNVKTVVVDGEKVKFKIWDSAGQERFKSLTTSYYRNSDAAILVYGIDNEESFESLHRWTKELDRCGKDGLVKIIVGNKSDLDEERAVSQESAVGFALADNAAAAVECSAKENENIEQLFQALARKLISMNSGKFGKAYIKDVNRNTKSSDPCAERLIKGTNQNQVDNGQNKPKLFNWPCLSSGCFRKMCGLC